MAAVCLPAGLGIAAPAGAANLKVMSMGLGSGTIGSSPAGISCGAACTAAFGGTVTVTLTASAGTGSRFKAWHGDCSGMATTCSLTVGTDKSVRAEFELTDAIAPIADLTPDGLAEYLSDNAAVNTAARFVAALPAELGFKKNWLLMSRSESLQTGTAETPRFLLPSADATAVFTLGLATHASYPGSHPNAIEYMQWDGTQKNFRFHEIVLAPIPAQGTFPARSRGISIDEARCFQCHSTNNVLNRGSLPGTTGIPPGIVKAKSKPNWDAYDSWGGMLSFNRDRLYQGSVEAESFRRIFNLWTWRANSAIRAIVEQLDLQPVQPDPSITRVNGGPDDGSIVFSFDDASAQDMPAVTYSFNALPGQAPGSIVNRGGAFLTLHHSEIPGSDEGRGVRLFDRLGGLAGTLNQERIADEMISHRHATGNVPIDVRHLALAITQGCLFVDGESNTVGALGETPLTIDLGFFAARHGGMSINELLADTRARAESLPRRKADIQRQNLDRTADIYLVDPGNGLIQQDGAATPDGTTATLPRLRQEVFRRPIDLGRPDATVMGGIYVDRELYEQNTEKMALFRYFLEPLGVSVDKWSMGVRGRSRTYTLADVFSTYLSVFQREIEASLQPEPGLAALGCDALVGAINTTLSGLPAPDAVPTYTDVQRIFNRSCIECHGGLFYPPVSKYFSNADFNLAENEQPAEGERRMTRSHTWASGLAAAGPVNSTLMLRITNPLEDCPGEMMPCGGPPLSVADIDTIRRWIVGGALYTEGDPHLRTADGTFYDFQSAGEFVLLRDEDVEIQARQSPVETEAPLGPDPHSGLSACVSLNTAVAVRVGGQRITYQPNLNGVPDPSGLQLRINGNLVQLGAGGIALSAGGRIVRTQAPGGIQIETPGGTEIAITPNFWGFHQLWYMNINIRKGRGTEGVMGTIVRGNWLPALPDGRRLGPRPEALQDRYTQLYQTFADAWRVDANTTLFDYAPGTSTETFTNRDWPFFQPYTCRVSEGGPVMPPLPPATAQQHCSAIVDPVRRSNCVKDVMITGEAGFATTYVRTERIQRNVPPTPPSLIFPHDDKIGLGSSVSFSWTRGRDPEGDPLTYRHCVWRLGETLTASKCRVLSSGATSTTVSGLKPGKAYNWKVTVEDGNNGTAHSVTRRFATKAAHWAAGKTYDVGERVLFYGHEYVCIKAHTSHHHRTPDRAPELWSRVIPGVSR